MTIWDKLRHVVMSTDNQPNPENLLLDYARRLERHRKRRRAVHLHLSRLRPQHRRQHHLRIAVNTIEDFVTYYEGQIFLLGSGDLIFVCRDANIEVIDDAIMRIKYLFSEDPLAAGDHEGEEGHGRFADIINLETQYPRFMDICEFLHAHETARKKRLSQLASQSGENLIDERTPLTPEQLGKLEQYLSRADLSNVLHRQEICAISPGSEPHPIFKELFISIMDLAQTVLPAVNLAANRWLFQHLTETLDRRVLKMLARADDKTLHSAFSVNLNVSTLLSPEFLEFDASLRMGSRGTLVIEMQMIDIMSDFSAFLFARDFIREKGYRICLDGVTADMLPYIDRQKMGIDLIKLNANSHFEAGAAPRKVREIKTQVEEAGKGRIILARCDNQTMVNTGLKMGITMFQGRHLDTALRNGGSESLTPATVQPSRPPLIAER